jgi:hypothetical protein
MTYTYYSTDVGTYHGNYVLYFANLSDLMDHLQAMYKCTANEIEFSVEWRDSELFTKHNGSIDAQFCENHNKSHGIDYDCGLELEAI